MKAECSCKVKESSSSITEIKINNKAKLSYISTFYLLLYFIFNLQLFFFI